MVKMVIFYIKYEFKIILSMAIIYLRTSTLSQENIRKFATEVRKLMTPEDFKSKPKETKEYEDFIAEDLKKDYRDNQIIQLIKKYLCNPDPKHQAIMINNKLIAVDLWEMILNKAKEITKFERVRAEQKLLADTEMQKDTARIKEIKSKISGLGEVKTINAVVVKPL